VSVKVVLPTALARHTEGQKAFDSDAKDLPGLIAEFDTKFPALAQNVKDENGKLRGRRVALRAKEQGRRDILAALVL